MDAGDAIGVIVAAALANRLLLAPVSANGGDALPPLREIALHGVLTALIVTLAAAVMWPLQLRLQSWAQPYPVDFLAIPLIAGLTALAAFALTRWRAPLRQARWWLIAATALLLTLVRGEPGDASSLAARLFAGFADGAAFAAGLLTLCALELRLQPREIPRPFRGLPVLLLNAALLALGCLGLAGIGG